MTELGTLAVDPRFVTRTRLRWLVMMILGLVGLVGGVIWPVVEYLAYRMQTEVWSTGKRTVATEVEGGGTVHWFILHTYGLDIGFTAEDGKHHSGKIDLVTWFGGIAPREEWKLAYDPSDPTRFVLEAQIDQGWTRFAMPVLALVAFSGLLGMGSILRARQQHRDLDCAQDLGPAPRVTLAPIVAVRQQGLRTTVAIAREGSKPRERDLFSRPDKSDNLLVVGERFVVGVAAANDPDNPIFLHENGYPFVMDEDQLARVRSLADASFEALTAETRAQS